MCMHTSCTHEIHQTNNDCWVLVERFDDDVEVVEGAEAIECMGAEGPNLPCGVSKDFLSLTTP